MEPDVKRDERVLIIDDQSLSQSYLRYALEQLGYNNLSYAERAQTALNLCKQNSYDLIICGYNLAQGKDGYQLFEELKLSGLQKLSCGLMFISADTDPQLVHSVLELQPDEFLAKPFVIRDLQLRIERLYSSRETESDDGDADPQNNQQTRDKRSGLPAERRGAALRHHAAATQNPPHRHAGSLRRER